MASTEGSDYEKWWEKSEDVGEDKSDTAVTPCDVGFGREFGRG